MSCAPGLLCFGAVQVYLPSTFPRAPYPLPTTCHVVNSMLLYMAPRCSMTVLPVAFVPRHFL